MILETERLIIRPITLDDKLEIFKYRSDTVTNKYQGWIPKTVDDVEDFIGAVAKQINEPNTWFQLVIIEKESKGVVGDLGIHFFDTENKQVELGFTLSKQYQNKGYATEAVARVVSYVFNDLGKHRVIASIDPNNTSSIRLVERVGFRKEAHFVESLWINGKWADDLVYALIEKNWAK
ncbi:MAG: GNAT family N-acetyltransferase [Bacteroidales bacterium]